MFVAPALAAETVAETVAEHGGEVQEAFWKAPEFWVAIAFLIMLALAGRAILRIVTTGLDSRAETIRNRVAEAERLKDEAQDMLANAQRKQHQAAAETAAIVERAGEEAARMAERGAEELDRALARREQMAMDRIAHAEAAAAEEVRTAAIDIAMEATRRLLTENLSDAKAGTLVDDAIDELPGKLN